MQQPARVAPLVRGVSEVEPARIAALAQFDLLPVIPAHVVQRSNAGNAEDPPPEYIAGLHWFVSGDPMKPTAIMAVRERYHFGYARRVLEIEHIAGLRTGVGRLLKQATVLAAYHGMLLSGETDMCNFEMLEMALKLGFRKDRTRVVWPL